MSDKTIHDFASATTLSASDIFLLEADPSGTPVYKKIDWSTLSGLIVTSFSDVISAPGATINLDFGQT